jgi:geranylgeranyl diphosphate synthase type I
VALCAGHDRAAAAALAAPFEELGVLFQLQDDVLDLYGDKGRERVGSDLREGKVSSLVVAHLERRPEHRDWLLGVLRADRAETSDADVRLARERFKQSGALDAVLNEIREIDAAVRLDPRLPEALRPVAEELLDLVLLPIHHLL